MKKIIKNTTLTDIEVFETGAFVPASGQLEIDPTSYGLWASAILEAAEENSQFNLDISTGKLVVNDGTYDLPPAYGKYHLKYPDSAFSTRFLSEPERSNGFSSKTVQDAIEEVRTSSIGGIYHLDFVRAGSFRNAWMRIQESGIPSDETMHIVPWDSKIIGLTFSNRKANADTKLNLWRVDSQDEITPSDLVFSWDLVNVRVARKSGFSPDVVLGAGDKLGVFAQDMGTNPHDGVFRVYLSITNDTPEEVVQNFSGYLSGSTNGTS